MNVDNTKHRKIFPFSKLVMLLMLASAISFPNLVIIFSLAVSFKDGGFISDSFLEKGTLDFSSSVRVRAYFWLLWSGRSRPLLVRIILGL